MDRALLWESKPINTGSPANLLTTDQISGCVGMDYDLKMLVEGHTGGFD